MNVAPLKRRPVAPVRRSHTLFPRLNERGSIEAISGRERGHCAVEFPRLNERGSIEAARPGGYPPFARWFPRLNERGSIEAQDDRRWLPALRSRFHV